ncbi:MAG: 16S rRNA (uracil(1498)-N(3))-methyltransferase [Pseudomonadota bacterium]
MTQSAAKIRLYVQSDLGAGRDVALERDQAHYVSSVMRRAVGDHVLLFNGRDGEWLAEITQVGKRAARLACRSQTRGQQIPPDLWLCFAPIKKARTDFIAEKACEMGCRRLVPVFTRNTNSERVRTDRLQAHGIEAAEQCGLMSVPEVAEPIALAALLEAWPDDRQLLFCDETGTAPPAQDILRAADAGPWAVLIGPEGGFTPNEAAHLRGLHFAHPASLGPRVLRADTAAVAALVVWQSVLGDWQANV